MQEQNIPVSTPKGPPRHGICFLPQGAYIPGKIALGTHTSVFRVAHSLYSDEEQGSPMLVHSF